MRTGIGVVGLNLFFVEEDKKYIKNNPDDAKLECILNSYLKPKVTLYVNEHVENTGIMEEPGFHMESTPPKTPLSEVTSIDVYLSKENWHKLTEVYDSEAIGGSFFTRCAWDRCQMSFWSEDFFSKNNPYSRNTK